MLLFAWQEGDAAHEQASRVAAVAAEVSTAAEHGTAAAESVSSKKSSGFVSPFESEELFDVIVVGAGAAGIGASLSLERAGLKVCLLEARQNAGGRARAHDVLHIGVPVDLGAQWVHCACEANPIVAHAPGVGSESFRALV